MLSIIKRKYQEIIDRMHSYENEEKYKNFIKGDNLNENEIEIKRSISKVENAIKMLETSDLSDDKYRMFLERDGRMWIEHTLIYLEKDNWK